MIPEETMRCLLGVLCLLFVTGGNTLAVTRVALVVGTRTEGVRAAIDLATVKVSGMAGVELLERAGVDRVLAEQKLTLAGLAEASKAISVGKLLSADLLAIV